MELLPLKTRILRRNGHGAVVVAILEPWFSL